jgi:hypothetical protein
MVDRNNIGYSPGRGIPTHSLDRIDTESRIFPDSESNIRTTADTISCVGSSSVGCSTSLSISSVGGASNIENTKLINTTQKQGNEVSMSSNISLMDILFNIPLCLTKDENNDTGPFFSDNFFSNSTDGPETIFPPYTRLFRSVLYSGQNVLYFFYYFRTEES